MSDPLTGELVTKYQQEDLKFLLESDDLFNDVTVLTEDEGNVAQEVLKALGAFQSKGGKRGTCVIVQQPIGDDDRPGVSFGPLTLKWTFLVLELREINKGANGTGKKAWTLARRIARILKPYRASGLTMNFVPEKPCVVPVKAALEGGRPLVAYEVRFAGPEGDPTTYTQVAPPTISCASLSTASAFPEATAGDIVTLTCATSGASIYYTTDLSHPCSQNSAAVPYSVPFVMAAGVLRVRAHKTGNVGSIVQACLFS